MLPLSIPLRFLSLNIYLTNAILDKALRTSHIIGYNDGIAIPFAKQILTVVIIHGVLHIYIQP